MTGIKIIIIYIIAFELYRIFLAKPIVRRWSKTKTDNELLTEHTTFFTLLGIGRIFEIIGAIVGCIIWLFFL
jgi:hypothetical protein